MKINKKKFNKKYLTFGVLSLFALALVTAGLVGYLSNTVQVDVEIKTPIVQSISFTEADLDGGLTTIAFEDMYSGGITPITFYIETDNQADVPITGLVENIVTNWNGVTCDNFEYVLAETTSDGSSSTQYDLIEYGFCSQGVDDYHVVFRYGPLPVVWDAGQTDVTEVIVLYEQGAFGTYIFSSQIVVE